MFNKKVSGLWKQLDLKSKSVASAFMRLYCNLGVISSSFIWQVCSYKRSLPLKQHPPGLRLFLNTDFLLFGNRGVKLILVQAPHAAQLDLRRAGPKDHSIATDKLHRQRIDLALWIWLRSRCYMVNNKVTSFHSCVAHLSTTTKNWLPFLRTGQQFLYLLCCQMLL